MDNTRVITPNTTPYVMAKNKMLQNKTNLAHSVPMYPMNGRSGAQIFMNTQSVLTATNMHFLPPTRTKSSNDIDLTNTISTIDVLKQQVYPTFATAAFSRVNRTYFVKTNTNSQNLPEMLLNQEFMFSAHFNNHNNGSGGGFNGSATKISSNHSKMSSCDNKFFNDSPSHEHESTVGGKTFVNSLKSFVHSLFKPIIDVVGSDNSNSKPIMATATTTTTTTTATSAAAAATTMSSGKQMFWGETPNHHHKSGPPPPTYCDKRNCTDSFCLSIDKQQPTNMAFSNREMFFDCDDYIEGGEDTIDFVADSTKFLPHSFGNEFDMDVHTNIQPTSNKDSIYYDCINKSDIYETPISTPPPPSTSEYPSPSPSESFDEMGLADQMQSAHQVENSENHDNKSNELAVDEMTVCNPDPEQSDENVQYCGKSIINGGPKLNRNTHRRRHRAKRKNKSSKYWKKGCAPNKNRHEKQRHEIEMNLHDDLESCSIENISFGQEEDIDLEIIDLDDENSPKNSPSSEAAATKYSTASAASAATPSRSICDTNVCIETPIPSPEKISGCIFTRFFPFNSSDCKQKSSCPSLPLRFLKKFPVPPQLNRSQPIIKECRPAAVRRLSESESDDSFIVFEEICPRTAPSLDAYNSRPRQLSECSDDFILFEDGTEDACLRYDTTDEDFYLTDSTDDETDSSSGDDSSDDSDMEHSPESRLENVKDNHQPDSGFEEKKVRFNLCPVVHEIRAWKFAYSQARKGPWEQMVRDRGRFEKRINEVSRILSPILAEDHREKIYEQRFQKESETMNEHRSSSQESKSNN